MKETLLLLDSYRTEILRNDHAFSILAHVLRNLSASSKELSEELQVSTAEVASTVTDLYRAGLISVSPSGFYFLRPKCQSILETLDMPDVALSSLAEEILPTMHRGYLAELAKCYYAHSDLKAANLLSLQICRFANEGLARAPEKVWYETLRMVNSFFLYFDRALPPGGPTLPSNIFGEGDQRSQQGWRLNELRDFLADRVLPENDELRDAVARCVVILVTLRIADKVQLGPAILDATRKWADAFVADSKVCYLFEAKPLDRLWTRCGAHYNPKEIDLAGDLLSYVRFELDRSPKCEDGREAAEEWTRRFLPTAK